MITTNPEVQRIAEDDRESPLASSREPRWIIDVGDDCRVGITTDDRCFVVLYPQAGGGWKSGKHIPRKAVQKMSELLAAGELA
jgi:hypothetical protein